MDFMQVSFEVEVKGKVENMRIKKKLEQDINEFEIVFDVVNRGKVDLEKNVKKY